MIWIFLVVAAVGIAFVLLGALSVKVAVLSVALKALLSLLLVSVGYFVLSQFFRRNHYGRH